MTKTKEALEADIRELQMAANIADTFHGRNCIAALDRIEAALITNPDTVTIKRSEVDRIVRMYDDIIDGYDVCRKTALEHKKILETALGEKK